ncbi:MAG: hypothetical protein Q4F65_03070 [Propionibacteriaceae bacterium]|nr:hypothetical protein [Propionibacteriaceae bacterium]
MTETLTDELTPSRGFRSQAAPDRLMRRLLGVTTPRGDSGAGAQRAFRASVIISAVRCTITYVLVPVLLPLLALSGWLAAPIGIALCIVAAVNGIVSLRRFWSAEHPKRWLYAAFLAVVFVILGIALVSDLSRLGGLA